MNGKREEPEHLSLDFDCAATGAEISLGFGYLSIVPMMPVFKGDELALMIPRDVLIKALQEGWNGNESGLWVDANKN